MGSLLAETILMILSKAFIIESASFLKPFVFLVGHFILTYFRFTPTNFFGKYTSSDKASKIGKLEWMILRLVEVEIFGIEAI